VLAPYSPKFTIFNVPPPPTTGFFNSALPSNWVPMSRVVSVLKHDSRHWSEQYGKNHSFLQSNKLGYGQEECGSQTDTTASRWPTGLVSPRGQVYQSRYLAGYTDVSKVGRTSFEGHCFTKLPKEKTQIVPQFLKHKKKVGNINPCECQVRKHRSYSLSAQETGWYVCQNTCRWHILNNLLEQELNSWSNLQNSEFKLKELQDLLLCKLLQK
jgi:hypothetical protein